MDFFWVAGTAAIILLWKIHRKPRRKRRTQIYTASKTLCSALWLTTWTEKKVGLLNHLHLQTGHGLLLQNCRRIHTYGMNFSIDVIFLNKHFQIAAIYPDVHPNRKCIGPMGARHTLELPGGNAQDLVLDQQLFLTEIRGKNKVRARS